MTLAEDNENIIPFERPIPKPAGKQPPPTGDWLSNLPSNTRFLVRPTAYTGSDLAEFTFASLHPCGAVLLWNESKGPSALSWYDPKAFCRNFELFAILQAPAEEPEEGEPNG